jgi:hypothetical protein
MPNWVYNSLSVSGDEEELTKLVNKMNKSFESNHWQLNKMGEYVEETTIYSNPVFSFRNIICPTDLDSYNTKPEFNKVTGNVMADLIEGIATGEDWYHWNLRNWGTKWDVAVADDFEYSETKMEQQSSTDLIYYFNTAWSPVDSRMLTILSEEFPTIEFDYYWEEEQGWGGEADISNGMFSITKEWDIPDSHAENLAVRDYCYNCESMEILDLKTATEQELKGSMSEIYSDCPPFAEYKEALDKLSDLSDTLNK